MERITSCESTLSELVAIGSEFNIGDRVRRTTGPGVATAKCSGDTAGTVRYVGPMAPKGSTTIPTTSSSYNFLNSPSEPSSPVMDPPSENHQQLPPSASSASLGNNNAASSSSGPIYI